MKLYDQNGDECQMTGLPHMFYDKVAVDDLLRLQRERIAELEQRLELWGTSLSGDRVKLDFGADGIACRDSTITLLEGEREGLLERIDELEGALKEIRTRLHTAGRRPEECYEMHIIDSVLMDRVTK